MIQIKMQVFIDYLLKRAELTDEISKKESNNDAY